MVPSSTRERCSSSEESLYTKPSLYSIIPDDVYWTLCQASRAPKYLSVASPRAGREVSHLKATGDSAKVT